VTCPIHSGDGVVVTLPSCVRTRYPEQHLGNCGLISWSPVGQYAQCALDVL
jgi:hypothetical protein